MSSPDQIVLSAEQRRILSAQARRARGEHRQVVRARIVLAAADGRANAAIARGLGCHVDTVRTWRRRFRVHGLAGLVDRPRPGRPRSFAPVVKAEVTALACALPAETGVPLSRWSAAELAREAVGRHVVETISASTVRRWLAEDALKPWQFRSWIFPRDPDFAAKATRALDLYDRRWQGEQLGEDDYVLCADEKSQLQALSRRHPHLPPAPGSGRRGTRVEHEYRRGGTLAYLGAYDVHRARMFGRTAASTGIAAFSELVTQVMSTEPYASARRVFWIVDNGASHAGQTSIRRMAAAWPTAILVHLPIHASWLNQIEIYFSIVQRKAIDPGDFADLVALAERLLAFQARYNATATPFGWRFTRDDLDKLLHRLAAHQDHDPGLAA